MPARFPCFDKQNDIYLNSSEKHLLALLYTQESWWSAFSGNEMPPCPDMSYQWFWLYPWGVILDVPPSTLPLKEARVLNQGSMIARVWPQGAGWHWFFRKWFVICCPRNWVFSKEFVHFTTCQYFHPKFHWIEIQTEWVKQMKQENEQTL